MRFCAGVIVHEQKMRRGISAQPSEKRPLLDL
jgi:hypothetical protein